MAQNINRAMPAPSGVFTRASSGLVRQIRADDVMYYGWQQIALSYIVFIVLAWNFYPGASMEWATIFATVGGVALAVCYALLAAVYPRSGGEYVFVSRVVHPGLGFAVSFSFAFWQIFYYGINGAFLSLYAVSPFFAVLGVQTGNSGLLDVSDWFSHGAGVFVAGSVMILTMAFLQYRGAGRYFRWQRWASYVAVVSILITVIVLLLTITGVFNFESNFNHFNGAGTYAQVVGSAAMPAGSVTATLNFFIWPAFSIWFAVAACSFSGEIKNVQRGQLLGINGAMITMGLIMALLMLLYRGAFGSQFLFNAGASTDYKLAAPPFVNVLTAIGSNNILLTILEFGWVFAIAFFVGGTTLVYSTRAMLAWSIDGVAPEWLGDVNERYHSPHWAILVSVIGGEIWLALYAFTHLLGPISGFLGFTISFLVVSLTAVAFPYLKKNVFESSAVAWRIFSLPVISVVGVISAAFVIFAIARILVDKNFSANLAFSDWGAIIVVTVGAIYFYAARAFRRSRGVDIDQRYREIPIE